MSYFVFERVSFFSGCSEKASLFHCDTPYAFKITIPSDESYLSNKYQIMHLYYLFYWFCDNVIKVLPFFATPKNYSRIDI